MGASVDEVFEELTGMLEKLNSINTSKIKQ